MSTAAFILMWAAYRGGVAMQEFDTQAACEAARIAILAKWDKEFWGNGPMIALCMPKAK